MINNTFCWQGAIPPQYIFGHAAFKAVALEPPNQEPGSWAGAGNCMFDAATGRFVLTSRMRVADEGVRGFAVEIHTSEDGVSFEHEFSITKELVAELSGRPVHSLEGVQLLRDPLSDRWYCYLSTNYDEDFTWGGIRWQTLLLTAHELSGAWEYGGCALDNDQPYDAHHARDATIGIIDGIWTCLYKARDANHIARPAVATSTDGLHWRKHGPLTIDEVPRAVWMNGTLFGGSHGPLFVGLEKPEDEGHSEDDVVRLDDRGVGHGGGVRNFAAYIVDVRNRNLECVFRRRWEARSPFEDEKHPVLGYASVAADPARHRMLLYLEAIDPGLSRGVGLNETVERLLVYEVPLPGTRA